MYFFFKTQPLLLIPSARNTLLYLDFILDIKEHTIKQEVGISTVNQKFVWAPIPGLPGPDADQDSYKFYKLAEQIGDNEEILGDGHYVGQNKSVIKTMKQYQIYRKEFGEVRAAVKI